MRLSTSLPLLVCAASAAAQVPQGWYAFGTFAGATSTLTRGIFLAHPRSAAPVTAVTGLTGDLTVTGTACILYRESDGALLVGERAPAATSVDVHVLQLSGTAVVADMPISVGTGNSVGEIPQMGWLPDGRVVVAATDLSDGPLKNYLTTRYGWQGLGIVDTQNATVTPVPISNGATIVDVFNALAVAPDGQSVYLGTYVSNTSGDIWNVPLPAGGPATLVANLPGGISNMAFDDQGYLWVTDAYTSQGLYKVDLATNTFVTVPHSAGAINGIAFEHTTGNFAFVTGGAGVPARSGFWTDPAGTNNLLATPAGIATPSGVAIRPNPARHGTGSAAANRYDWALRPNPGGLPLTGNAGFSLTLRTTGSGTTLAGVYLIATQALATPLHVLGVDLWLDPATIHLSGLVPAAPLATIPLPIPADPSLVGLPLFAQGFALEAGDLLGATPAVAFTTL